MFEQLLAQAPMPVYVYDAQDRFVFVNEAFEGLFDRPSRDFVGRAAHEVFDDDVATSLTANNAAVRERGRQRFQEVVPTAEGDARVYATEKFRLGEGRVAGVSVDITDQVAAEESLRERQAVLDVIARDAADMITLHDLPSGRVRWASAGSCALLGIPPEELVGTMPEQWLVLDDPAALVEEMGAAAGAGRAALVQRQARTADGHLRWVEINTRPNDPDPETGEPRAAVAILRDITDRHEEYEQLQTAARQHETDLELLRHALEAIADPVAVEDLGTGDVVFTNSPMAEAMTSDPDAGWREGDLAEHVRQHRDELSSPGDAVTLRSTFRHSDGRSFPVEILVQRFEHHGRELALGVARDISELMHHQRQLERREQRFRALAEASDGLVYRFRARPEPRFTYLNPRTEELTGYTAERLKEDPYLFRDRIHEDDRGQIGIDPSTGRITAAESEVVEFRFRRADGTWVWFEDHRSPELDAQGEVVGRLGIVFDVTASHEREEARTAALEHERRAAEQLRRTMRAHEAFLRGISHELRTPLTTVIGFARTLQSHLEALSVEQRQHLLGRIVGNAERLGDLIEQLLDLDRLTRGALDLDLRDDVDLGRLCRDVVADVDAPTHEFQLEVAPVTARVDRPKIERVVDHLVRNAVRHTPAGCTVRVSLESCRDEVVLTVVDDGPGIPPEVRDEMFEPFRQGDEAAGRPSPGTGIGLSMVRAIVELHGGQVCHQEGRPTGAELRVTLPRTGPPAPGP